MDKDHRLDAPDEHSLQSIEQVSDHSNLSNLYPSAHNDWESETLLSREAREEKRDAEQLQITLSIRKWFVAIGLLTPLPVILAILLFISGFTFLGGVNQALLIAPLVITAGIWIYISYRSLKKVYGIFYEHSLRATPFIVTLLSFLVFSLVGLYLAMEPFYTDSLLYNAVVSSLIVLLTSVAYSGILLMIWTSPKLGGIYKIGCIGIFAGIIAVITLLVNAF